MNPNTQPNPFSPFRPGPGKPSLRRDYLNNQREKLRCLIEPHWYELEWNLKRARTVDQVHRAFQMDTFKRNPDILKPLMRPSSKPSTKKDLEVTRKRLTEAVRKMHITFDKHQEQLQRWENARRIATLLSEKYEKRLRDELNRREVNVRALEKQAAELKETIRECRLTEATRTTDATPKSAALLSLEQELLRVEQNRATERAICADYEGKLRAMTPEARELATEDLATEKALFDVSEAELRSADIEQREIEIGFLDQEAFFYRDQLLKFIQAKEYALNPLHVANALAGLPYVTARQSARLCAPLQSDLATATAYELFEFVTKVWKRYRKRSKAKPSLSAVFEAAIRRLPKFQIANGHKRSNSFRGDLARNWYFLQRALQEPELAKLRPGAVPGAIVKLFFGKLQNPDSLLTLKIAEREQIVD